MKSESTIRRSPTARPNFAGFRRYVRQDVHCEVVVQDDEGWEIPFDSVNLSPTGMFVESEYLFEVGDQHVLIFRSPENDAWFRVEARVVRTEQGDPDVRVDPPEEIKPGMAYEFVGTDDRTWAQLCCVLGA